MEHIRDFEIENADQHGNMNGEEQGECSRSRSTSISSNWSRAPTTDTEDEDYQGWSDEEIAPELDGVEVGNDMENANAGEPEIIETGEEHVEIGTVGEVVRNAEQHEMPTNESAEENEIDEIMELVRGIEQVEAADSAQRWHEDSHQENEWAEVDERDMATEAPYYYPDGSRLLYRKTEAVVIRQKTSHAINCVVYHHLAEEVKLYEDRVTKRFQGKLTAGTSLICDIGEAPDGTLFVMKIHEIGRYYYLVEEDVKKIPHKSILISLCHNFSGVIPLRKAADDSWRIYSDSRVGPIKVKWDEKEEKSQKWTMSDFQYVGKDVQSPNVDGIKCYWHQKPLDPELKMKVEKADAWQEFRMTEYAMLAKESESSRPSSRASTISSGFPGMYMDGEEEALDADFDEQRELYLKCRGEQEEEELDEEEVLDEDQEASNQDSFTDDHMIPRRGRFFSISLDLIKDSTTGEMVYRL